MKTEAEKKSILIIDDDSIFSLLTKIHLEKAGYVTHTCDDPSLAIDEIKHLSPDLMMIDLNMPEINGYELSKLIRKTFPVEQHNPVPAPILFMTGSEDDTVIEKAYAAGANDFILKTTNWPWTALNYKLRYLLQANDDIKIAQLNNHQLKQVG